MIVLDASVTVDLLVDFRGAGASIAERIAALEGVVHAPHLLDVEVAHALRRRVRAGLLEESDACAALEDLADLPLLRHGHQILMPRVWELRENATAYDAVYLALAEALDAVLLTRDPALASVPGFRGRVEIP
jgi:predicted nucleic acid-binding protein